MNKDINKIKDELINVGAKEEEAEELAFLSKNLSNAYSFERSDLAKNKFLEKVGKTNYNSKHNLFYVYKSMFASVVGIILLLSFATFVGAQDSLPGQPLYPVKRISENLISAVNPSFNAEIIKRRSREIKNLSDPDNNAIDNSENIRKTIREYERELNEHGEIDVKAIEESKINLEEAIEHSLDDDKKEIEDVLRRTEINRREVRGDKIIPKLLPIEDKEGDWNIEAEKEDSKDYDAH